MHANAAIIISEIAWMGSASSANDEWIELHNTGATAVAVDAWRLTDGNTINATLSGSIPALGYAVLERTDDTSAPGPMFIHYTGALSNTGATLSLLRSDDGIEDQVAGGENWEHIGGDNVSKHTPQYALTQWVTASPTPGYGASSNPPAQDDEEEVSAPSEKERAQEDDDEQNVAIELQLPDTELALALEAPDIAYVNQTLSFDVEATGIGKSLLDSLAYSWNFGDLSVQNGKSVQHAYAHPGEYVVTLHAAFARHEQVARKTITVLPVAFVLSRSQEGDIFVHNNAKYEVNVSGYTLKGNKHIVFPPRTILLPNGTVRVPLRIGAGAPHAALFDSSGTQVAILGSVQTPVPKAPPPLIQSASDETVPVAATAQKREDATVENGNFSFANEVSIDESEPQIETVEPSHTQLAALPSAASFEDMPQKGGRSAETLPFLGLAGVVALGIFAVFFTRKTE